MTDLVLFTAQYPYGVASETFLESEVPVLAARFRRIVILPHSRVPGQRAIPENVEVVVMPWIGGPTFAQRLSALVSTEAGVVFRDSLKAPREVLRNARAARKGVDILTRNVDKYRILAEWVPAQGLGDAIFYDYWFENSTVALALLRRAGRVRLAVARAHGFDIYDDMADGLTVPFRRFKSRVLDAVVPTSQAAAEHLATRAPESRGKIHVHRLGVPDPGATVARQGSGAAPLIVTCSRLVPVKRIIMVPEVLACLGTSFCWIHIGDGPERERVEASARRLLNPGSWEVRGQLSNEEVIAFYRSEPVSVVLSVSASEGIPVSMMEAQSFGIPIVSTDVGGVGEIVNSHTGVLVPPDATPAGIADALRMALTPGRFDPRSIHSEWAQAFEATTNYGRFADFLLTLHQRGH